MSLALLTSALERLSPSQRQPSTPAPPAVARRAAAANTVEALCYSLRSGIGMLAHPEVRQRLSLLTEDQLRDVCTRMQRHKPPIAPPWSEADVEKLIAEWKCG
jgi:hypothetical protein